jgi:hypothetical protein
MDYFKKSSLPDLAKACAAEFGGDKGGAIFRDSSDHLAQSLKSADFRKSREVEKHMRVNILPGIAFYQAMLKNGIGKEKAYRVFHDELQKSSKKMSDVFKVLKFIPGFQSLMRRLSKKMATSPSAKDLWDLEIKRDTKEEFSYDITRCVYTEILSDYDCPELCKAFCDTDITSMKGLEPDITLVRTQTLGYGGSCCDNRYLMGKKK